MPALLPIFKKAYWSLVALGSIYASLLLLLTHPTPQRHVLYAHKLHTGYWDDLERPESSGFGKNEVTPFFLTTPDGEEIYGWHILPLAVYAQNERQLSRQPPWSPSSNFTDSLACKLLIEDPEARVIINFHGNAGHVAQGQRPATYRSLTSASPKIHVFTVDYRGFGLSTGAPTERGVAADGVALVNFVLNLGIPPSRIVILGQSLGTAVSSAVALHFADPVAAEKHLLHEPIYKSLSTEESANVENHAEFGNSVQKPIDFAAVILVASFSSLPKLLLNYRIGGFLPLLSPLRPYPRFQKFFLGRLHDTWNTSSRLTALTSTIVNSPERSLRLHILHARNDWDIPWRSGEENFQRAEEALYPTLNPNEEGKVEKVEGTGVKLSGEIEDNQRKEVWLGESRRIELTFEILRFGGHNKIVADVPVAVAVLKAFGLV
ncbi:hypothetical protein EG327_006240 [Venturia inaequalis]|uniref:AB hydrolase-1 domain-containing protein n=1 Tax=Venturia inaequalis TaxID=5025 RepID=A0A8H3Z5I9_VENIN|nr:hypothetical protein EG327_006240 [Venturia inaequalis]